VSISLGASTPRGVTAQSLYLSSRDEYIESQLAKRYSTNPSQATSQSHTSNSKPSAISGSVPSHTKIPPPEGGSIRHGKLQEVDLGDEIRAKNIAMTERATRRLQGEAVEEEDTDNKPKKVRLGPDGKPWRGRKRRMSEDVNRDRLVEDFLHENRRTSASLRYHGAITERYKRRSD